MAKKKWMIYGANGYTGKLIAEMAKVDGLEPVLAGRSAEKIESLAKRLGFESAVFDLDDSERIENALKNIHVLLHCAGPFSATSAPMIEACLKTGTHYLDITGEIDVFEYAYSQNDRAIDAGIVICPGVGFDVIPTDCVAAHLKAALPDANRLMLGFDAKAGLSAGTAKSSVEGMALGNRIRENGRIKKVPMGYKAGKIDFGNGPRMAMVIPWGDVSSAYQTTGIPNIEVFASTPPKMVRMTKYAPLFTPFLKIKMVQNFLKNRIEKTVKGPSEKARKTEATYVWGKVSNSKGEQHTAYLQTGNGYEITIHGALAAVNKLLAENCEPGSMPPSRLLGKDIFSTFPNTSAIRIVSE